MRHEHGIPLAALRALARRGGGAARGGRRRERGGRGEDGQRGQSGARHRRLFYEARARIQTTQWLGWSLVLPVSGTTASAVLPGNASRWGEMHEFTTQAITA